MNSDTAQARAFARITATEVTQAMQEQGEKGLFLTIYTDPDRPEPEVPLL